MPEKTPSEEIAGQIAGVMTQALGKEGAERTGVVFGEEHTNNEFHQMLAAQILPQAAELAGNTPRNLFLEWDNTEENLALIDEYHRTGDPAVRDHLVETNLDFANDEKEHLVERDFKAVLDSARENGFTIQQ